MKKRKFILLAGVSLVMSGLVACQPADEPVVTVEKYTVKFVDGDKVLHTEEVEKGEKVSEWDPTKTVTDKIFNGWFAEPTLTHEFDFSTAINADTTIFGSFSVFTEDTRTWVVAGSGTSNVLRTSSWGTVVNDEHKMSKKDVANENIFTFTIDLFKGDQFQFMVPEYDEEGTIAWGAQRGGGYLQDAVKDGTTYFSTGGGLGGNNQKTNMTAEVAGNYTFELHTHPAEDMFFDDESDNPNQNYSNLDYITWVRNGDTTQEVAETETTFYIKGEKISEWKDMYNDFTKMTTDEDRKIHTLSVFIKKDDQIMFASRVKDMETLEETAGNEYIKSDNVVEGNEYFEDLGGSNMKFKADGYYTFTYDSEAKECTVTLDEDYVAPEYDYYVNGNFDNDPSWANKVGNEEYKLTPQADNPEVLELKGISLKANEELGIQTTAVGDPETRVTFYNSSYLFPGLEDFSYEKTNIVALKDGKYDLTFNLYSKIIKLTPAVA